MLSRCLSACNGDGDDHKSKDNEHDQAVDMTFPASDATAHGLATGTEPLGRRMDTKAPIITREQIDQALRGEGHKRQENKT